MIKNLLSTTIFQEMSKEKIHALLGTEDAYHVQDGIPAYKITLSGESYIFALPENTPILIKGK